MKIWTFNLILLAFVVSSCSEKDNQPLYPYDVEQRIKDSGIELRTLDEPSNNYVHYVQSGNLIHFAGKGPRMENGEYVKGKVGGTLDVEDGYKAARLVAIEQLSALKMAVGDLNNVVRIVKVLGMVNSDPSFTDQPSVINGYSDVMVEIFGERGKHARSAVGMNSLPSNIAVEIEMIVEMR